VHTLFLIHGGLWQDMDADLFWTRPGITPGLHARGYPVLTPDRLPQPPNWPAEADHLLPLLPDHPATVIAASNGCSAAVRLALTAPDRIDRLLLAWPATAGDPSVDTRTRQALTDLGVPPAVIEALLTGETLRGVTDAELATLPMPIAILPSVPDNPTHQRHTAEKLLTLLPHAAELPGSPEPPQPTFPPYLAQFLETVTDWLGDPVTARA
jgi:pimeloyl-ACP methyl ester carboxylesterase